MAWHPFRNLGLKVAALGLGTLLWFAISGQQVERTVSRVPVVYRNVPTGLQITGDLTEAVTVHVRGSENQISLELISARFGSDLPAGFELDGEDRAARAGFAAELSAGRGDRAGGL